MRVCVYERERERKREKERERERESAREPAHLKPVYILIINANVQLGYNAIPQGKACQHYEPEKKCRQMHGRIFGL